MNAPTELLNLYSAWRLLTEQEGDAIRHGQWDRVAFFQHAKQDLQPQIVAASEQAQGGPAATAPEIAALLTELMALEQHNQTLLASRHQAALDVRADWDRSSRNLRQIQRSYSGGGASNWAGYG